ncbi:MAG: hypothetical protein AAFY05_16640 [Pseudomonadota bacterium]
MTDNAYPSGQINQIKDTVKDRSPHWQKIGFLLIVGLLLGFCFRFLEVSETWSQLIDRIVISLGFFILLFGLVWREISRIRKEKYANIQEDIHGIQHIIRDQYTILSLMEQISTAETRLLYAQVVSANVQECLNRLASIFTLLSGTKCRASVKMIEPGASKDKPVVYTYMRDVDSERFCEGDDIARRDAGSDLLEDNTDFSHVFGESGERWFFCNDLPSQSNYLNSRDGNLSRRNLAGFRGLLNFWRPVDWNLPYRSSIVWPIRQKPMKAIPGSEFKFVGFLTIDSRHRGVFDINFDTHLGAGIADSLYYMLVRLDEVGNTGEENE